MRRVHGEATECVVFIGRQRNTREPTGLDGTGDGNEAWRIAERRKRTSYGRNGGPVDREGCGVPQNGGNGLVLERYGRNGGPVHREGCGVPQNGTPRDTVHLHRRPPPASTGYCSSTVDLLQPPPVTVHPRAPVHPASTARYSTGYCSTTPPPSTVHPALHTTGSCSTTPPRAPLHRLLFIQPSTPRGPVHPEATPPLTVHPPLPPAMLTVHPIDRLQLAAVAKESLDRVQLTAIDRSLGFSNA